MSQIGKFTIVFISLIFIMEFFGIQTGLGAALEQVGVNLSPTTGAALSVDLENSQLYGNIFLTGGILASIAAGVVIVGLFTRTYDTSLVVLPLIVFVAGLFISTTGAVISQVATLGSSWLTKLIGIIFVALGLGFIWSCVDYFRTGQ